MSKMATWFLMGTLGLGFGGARALAADPANDTNDTGAATNTDRGTTDTGRANADDTTRVSDTGSANRTAVKMSELPPAVRSTFKHEAKGGKIEELRKETRTDGSVVYNGEIVKRGMGTGIEVNSDGMVVDRGKAHEERGQQRGTRNSNTTPDTDQGTQPQ